MPLASQKGPGQWSNFRVDFQQHAFLQEILTKGYPALWEKNTVCPNAVGDVNQHRIDCTLCDGKGYVYYDAVPMRCLITSISLKEMWKESGRFDLGTGMITTEPGVRLYYWDRITLTDSMVRYSERLQRGSLLSERLKYAPVVPSLRPPVDNPLKEPLPFVPPFIYCLDQTRQGWHHNLDFTVSGNQIQWVTGRGPAEGMFYSLAYFFRPVYIVLDLVHHFRDSPVGPTGPHDMQVFPTQAVARLEFLIGEPSETPQTPLTPVVNDPTVLVSNR